MITFVFQYIHPSPSLLQSSLKIWTKNRCKFLMLNYLSKWNGKLLFVTCKLKILLKIIENIIFFQVEGKTSFCHLQTENIIWKYHFSRWKGKLLFVICKLKMFLADQEVREGSNYQIGWTFGKIPNGRWPPPLPHFWKIMLQIFYDGYGRIYARMHRLHSIS